MKPLLNFIKKLYFLDAKLRLYPCGCLSLEFDKDRVPTDFVKEFEDNKQCLVAYFKEAQDTFLIPTLESYINNQVIENINFCKENVLIDDSCKNTKDTTNNKIIEPAKKLPKLK